MHRRLATPLFIALLLFSLFSTAIAHGHHDDEHGDHEEVQCNKASPMQFSAIHPVTATLLFVVSFLGVLITFMATHFSTRLTNSPFTRFLGIISYTGQHFGTGIILATSIIHMYPAAQEAFENECIGAVKHVYNNFPGVILLATGFAMHALEFWLSEAQHKGPMLVISAPSRAEEVSIPIADKFNHSHSHGHSHGGYGTNEGEDRGIATRILELGIALHSVIIGIALGLLDPHSHTYVPLLLALCFHQFFEGLALGTRIALTKRKRAIVGGGLMMLAFALTTPMGVFVGMLIERIYPINSVAGLVIMGTLDSIAAGVLLYVGYVHLLSSEMLHVIRDESRGKKVLAFVAVWLGAATMAVIGIYA